MPFTLETIVEDVKNQPVVPQVLLEIDVSNDPNYSMEAFKRKLFNNAEMDQNELVKFIAIHYKSILQTIFDLQDLSYLQFFVNRKFILTLTSVISQVNIDSQIRRYCNKIVYDYITCESVDKSVYDLMIGLAKVVNRDTILILKGLKLKDISATYLAISAMSHETQTINIRRTNFVIATHLSDMWESLDDEEDMLKAEQLIIDIYQKLFENVSLLFEAIMFDIYDVNAPWMTEKIEIMYSLTSTAALDIVNSFPIYDIMSILKLYTFDYNLLRQNGARPRFSLNNLSNDYARINEAIYKLACEENLYVP